MRIPSALRRLAVVSAVATIVAGLPFTPASAGAGDVRNVNPISGTNTGPLLVEFDVQTAFLPVPEPTVKFVRALDASDTFPVSESAVTYDAQSKSFDVTAPLLRENPGAWNIEVTGKITGDPEDHVDSCVECFTILAPKPTITAFTKTVGGGATGVSLTITGTNFVNDVYCSSGPCTNEPTISVSGTGVTLSGSGSAGAEQAATGGTTLTKKVDVATGAATGPRDIVLTHTDGKNAICTGCLVVGATPTITAVSPAGLAPGASNRAVTITGTNFASGATVAFSNPAAPTSNGVTVSSLVVNSATQMTATVSVADGTGSPAGDRTVTVTNTDSGTASRADLFDVNAKPNVTGVDYRANAGNTPLRYGQGAIDRTLRINGTGFQSGATVAIASSAGITVNSQTIDAGGTWIDLDVTLNQAGASAPSATTHAITVTNPDGGVSGSTTNFTIGTGPQLTSVSPSARGRGETVNLTLSGSGFATGGVTVEIQDVTIDPAKVTVTNSSTVTITDAVIGNGLNIAGPRDVVVTNDDDKGRFVCDDCFSIANLQVNTISPSNVLNEGVQRFTITGSGFTTDAVASLRKTGSGAGVVSDVTGTTVSVAGDGNSMSVDFPMDGVSPGSWQVRVTNPVSNPGTGSCLCSLTVVAPTPDVTGVAPSTRGEGAKGEVITIAGTGFTPGATVAFSNSKITVVGNPVVTPTSITATIDIASGAFAEDETLNEPKTLTVSNTDGKNDTTPFAVSKAPTATSIDITSRGQGTVTTIELTGDDLVTGARLLFSGTGVTSAPGTVTQAANALEKDKLAVSVTVAADATPGPRTVTVVNPDGGRHQCASCQLTINPKPTVTSVTPAKAASGATTVVTLAGTYFSGTPTVTAGPGVTATVTGPGTNALTVDLVVASGAATGNRTITVTNADGGSASLADAYKVFTVPGAPTNVSATRGAGQATVTWTAPASDGNDPITGYTVTAAPGGATQPVAAGTTTATVTGLTNGTAYTFTVVATNDAGNSPASAASSPVTPITVPGAPTAVTATPGHEQATLTWTAPASNGGSTITTYTVTATPGGKTVTVGGAATGTVVTGLTAGTPYTFTVYATNEAGDGPLSDPSNATAPTTLPGSPTAVVATPGNASATVTWTAPASDGGTPVTSYTVTSSGGHDVTVPGTQTSATVAGLTNGTAYRFVVVATNVNGTGLPSEESASVTPRTVPDAPTLGTVTPGAGSATVTWTAPAGDGGSPITGYVVTAMPGDHTADAAAGATGATVTGLTNGTAYTFTVAAKNVAGTGTASAASAPVTPRTLPGAPTGVSAVRGDRSASLAWDAPADNGGAPITGYTVTATPGGATQTVAGTSAAFTELTNGTEYTFSVVAVNEAGSGPAGTSNAVTPAGVPTKPANVSATAGNATATVTWTASDPNGSPLTGYTVTATPGGATQNVTGTTATFTGLTNGTAYTFTVGATNGVGTAVSDASAPVTPRSVPGIPTGVSAVRGDRSASLAWTAPADDGGADITGYTVTATPGGATQTVTGTSAAFTELTNGTEYTFSVVATNAVGDSAAAVSNAVTPAGVPTKPANVSATPGNTTATVTWTASDPNGSPLTGYTVTATPGGATQTVTGTTATFTGLTNGTAYTFTVGATNGVGTAVSDASAPVTPRTVPGVPTAVTATRGDQSATVSWTAPADNGGAPITGYTITVSPGGGSTTVTGTSATFTALANGVEYTFAVAAVNESGSSAAVVSNAVTPAGVPAKPANVSATPGNGTATVTWTASDPNGSPLTGYTVTAAPGGASQTVTDTTTTFTGLTNGTAYTFTVSAANAVGSTASDASAPVTPRTVPGLPTAVSATRGDQSATVTWTAPADNGGAPVSGYTVTATPGGATATVTGTAATVTGLTNGTEYTFAVVATNEAGSSAPATSNAVTPAGLPAAPANVVATAGHAEATVTWTAPAGNGSPVTGYTVTVSPGGVTQNVTGTTATFGGLTNGTLYTFSVRAVNAVGTGAAGTSNAVRPTWVTTLTEVATAKVTSGGIATVRGALTRSDGAGIQGATIQIYRKVAPATTYSLVRTVTTGTGGAWSTTFTVTKNTAFQARFAGVPGYDAATSPARLVRAAYKVTRTYSISGRTVTVKGAVSPNAAGRTIYLRHRRTDGSVVNIAKATVSSRGTYTLTRTLNRGTYYLYVYIGSSTTNVATSTPRRKTVLS